MPNFKLRDYQIKALNQIDTDLKTQKNVLCSAIMGAGKTILAARLINKYYKTSNKRFLILAHKQELILQFHKTFLTKTDIPEKDIGICCAGLKKKETGRRVTIGSIQTFINNFDDYPGCDLLVVDEVHKATIGTNSQYDKTIDYLRAIMPNMRLLGLTATAFRLGSGYIYGNRCKPGTINLFSKINYKISYEELKKAGYLMSLEGKVILNDNIATDLDNIDKNGDYVLDQLGNMMSKAIHIDTAVEAIQKYAEEYKFICVFTCTIAHAEALKNAIDIAYPKKVTIVHSKLTAIERANNMQAWKTGTSPIMISINILVEGFDFPPLDCLIMARPTESTGLFLQAIGRVLRISEGKEKTLLIDLTTNTQKFGTDLDNMKVIIPKSANEAGKKKNEKYCPECDEKVHIAIRICPKCQHEWTIEENETIVAKQLPELSAVMFQKKEPEKLFPDIPPTWHDVYDMIVITHKSKSDKMLGRIDLYYDSQESYFRDTRTSIYLCFSDFYSGYAVEKAHTLWQQFSDEAFPENVKEFTDAKDNDYIKMPDKILLDHNEKWPKLLELEFIKQKQESDYEDDLPF